MSLVFFKTFFHFSVVKMMLIVLSGRQLNGTSFLVVGLTEKDWVNLLNKLKDFSSQLSGVVYDFSNGIDDVFNTQFDIDLVKSLRILCVILDQFFVVLHNFNCLVGQVLDL